MSDTFTGECDTISLELIVQVINVNYEKGSDILSKCETLKNYSIFVHKVRTKRAQRHDRNTAIAEAIDECIREGILVDFLKKNRGEIMSFLHIQLSQEEREEIREKDGYTKGKQEGRDIGISEGTGLEKHATARRMKASGFTTDQIIQATELSKEEIENL